MMVHQAGRTAGSHGGPGTALPQTLPQQPRPAAAYHDRQVLTTKVGLQMPGAMAYAEWERTGRRLAGIVDSSCWWLGDWLVYGKDHYADRYQRGIRAVGLSYQTLRNYAWVSRRFGLDRRRSALSFQHHAELASLPPEEQDVWLDRTERLRWTTKQLRGALRDGRGTGEPVRPAVGPNGRLEVPGGRLEWWHKAAEQSGVEFGRWVTSALDSAAASALDEPAEPLDEPAGPNAPGGLPGAAQSPGPLGRALMVAAVVD
ncbi:LmbU family transcriptional regulator [Streptomyces sp. NPDC102402]|uniref:LmbU family transcriptional regulator n=1 Tax=Streptomyces sp. NPDC102402 TaxID=3366169 RepID=UPI00381C4A45